MRPTSWILSRSAALALLAVLSVVATEARGVSIAWSPVGSAGNAANLALPNPGHGAVAYDYQIATYDVTISQYTEFLNTKDPTGSNVLGLYNSLMNNQYSSGIAFNAGSATGQKYAVLSGNENRPVNYISWYDAIRFTNWLNNGEGNGDTEKGAYTLGPLDAAGVPVFGNSITRNAVATVFLPSEDEWYKAAFYNAATSSYFKYPTSSNTMPFGTAPPGPINSANFNSLAPTNVGAYTGTTSPYGVFDMAGNVEQWTDSLPDGSKRALRGSFFREQPSYAVEFAGGLADASADGNYIGFRVASIATVPEPNGMTLAGLGFAALAASAWRRRKPLGRSYSDQSVRLRRAAGRYWHADRAKSPRGP